MFWEVKDVRKPLKGSSGNLNLAEESGSHEACPLSWAVPSLRLVLYYSRSRGTNLILLPPKKKTFWDFHQSIRKHFFTVRVVEHCNRFPREVVEPPTLEIFKTRLDMVLGNLIEVAFSRGFLS